MPFVSYVELLAETHAIVPTKASLLQASDDTIYRAGHVWRFFRRGANHLLIPAGTKDVEKLAERLELSDTGVRAKKRDGYDVQVEELPLPRKPNSNANIGRAFACKCIQSD
ncbi:hypothetical protein KXD40_009467 [Peronospora effusa]|uniref:Uncharacterized protein n=1 Tax=Peronospora effusa TaxID=542832 RepID=A0A3M6VCR1_9STRA|nr:hypothetical protein DD238_007873 [Peronospora effusa]RQM13312.1 hypothetical protein DD237_007279 [Peronospora effusa]UIZ28657.1 hypothetical protein KXD40_009467 [Peronospora effusa]CAI5702650.1 unnamed protein product [Peronospora effusa]